MHFFAILISPILAQESKPSLSSVLEGYVQDGKVDYDGLRKDRMPELMRRIVALEMNAAPGGGGDAES